MMHNVGLKLGNKQILEQINWQLEQEESCAIFGMNGCGKTSLLSLAAAFLGASQGEVTLFGEKVTPDNKIRLRKRIGFVSSSFFDRYYRSESIMNIVLSGLCGGLGIDDTILARDIRKAKELLAEYGLKQKTRYNYHLLSQGQRQRVLIVRALLVKPKLLILDEPCSGMDILAKAKFLQTLERLVIEEGVSIVYVSHQSEEFSAFFNKILLLKNGKIVQQGKLEQIFQDETMSDFFEVPTKIHFFEGKASISVKL